MQKLTDLSQLHCIGTDWTF